MLFFLHNCLNLDHEEAGADNVLKEISEAARQFLRSLPTGSNEARVWTQLVRCLPKWIEIYDAGSPCSHKIIEALRNMSDGDILLFYVKPQNAAIVVRSRSTGAIFECFEVLPKTDAVLAAKDALIRNFPARAVFLAAEEFRNASFIRELGDAIHKLSVEKLELAMETSSKGKNTVVEQRQSAHPRAVTEWLFGVLSSRGKATSSPTVRKRTHDDVCWTDTDKEPWRRSGIWTCARVALQIALQNSDLAGKERSQYKNFMLYLLSRLATEISEVNSSPDTLHVLRVKLARRNAKLASETISFVQNTVQTTLSCLNRKMQKWEKVIQANKSSLPKVPVQEVSDRLAMKNSRSVVQAAWLRSRQPFTYPSINFVPQLLRRVSLTETQLPDWAIFRNSGDVIFALADFENWVGSHLANWLYLHCGQPSSCQSLALLMQTYHQYAKSRYQGHPERTSLMLLTLFDLWVALDRAATKACPLLLQYPPELVPGIFAPLLLFKQPELERLHRIEDHISSRLSGCKAQLSSLFSDPTDTCFAVKYFDQSASLQKRRADIESQARKMRVIKSDEWNEKMARFEKLMSDVQNMECGVFVPPQRGRRAAVPRHDWNCTRCAMEKEAKAIQITKEEWPLPETEVMVKAVTFELMPPPAITYWRDTTWFLVHDLGRTAARTRRGQTVKQLLRSYPPLASFAEGTNHRIALGSSVKSMQKSHYFTSGLNMDEVFVKNGLQPRMLDTNHGSVWTAEQVIEPSLSNYCNAPLPEAVKDHLGPFVNMTHHTQNSVIAKHCLCPNNMSPHEHVLFGSLRSGERLQWINILAMLTSTEIDLNSSTTAILILYAISQVGTAGAAKPQYLRESQHDLNFPSFCHSLLEALEASFARIEANWKESIAAGALLTISLKVLSLKPYQLDKERWNGLVLRIRHAGISWIRQLSELHKHQKTKLAAGHGFEDLPRQIVNACLLTRQTFNTDVHLLPSVFSDDGAVADYIEASIHLHDHSQQVSVTADGKQKSDLLNDQYLARQCEKPLLDRLRVCDTGFSEGINRFWQFATFTTPWDIVDQNDTSWIQNKVLSKVVHFNVVTGSLLVSGRPLSRLPAKYLSHPLYRSVFGDLDLDVFASDLEDMEYVSRAEIEGHRVYFGMRDDTLIVRSSIAGQSFEAILRDTFLGDIPDCIVKPNIPWMSLEDGRVFFRPTTRPWVSQADDWILTPDIRPRTTISLRNGRSYLIDHASTVGSAICQIFRPIECPNHVLISMHDGVIIKVHLPRYHLNFHVSFRGELQCQELAARIDSTQTLGTLHGLTSFLILRAASDSAGAAVRSVLIPDGDVVISSAPPHVAVEVRIEEVDDLTFSHYRIDDRLGRLVADDLEGHLFKTYLHAVTSFPENDQLTGRAGSEESLLSLSDPITRTSLPLSERSQKLLSMIAKLSPVRRFYPPHLRAMHSDTFNGVLPTLSQRDIFYGTVEEIVLHNLKSEFLFKSGSVQSLSYAGQLSLLDRSYRRTRKLYPCESVATETPTAEDQSYLARDRDSSPNQEAAASMAGLVAAWPSAFNVCSDLRGLMLRWQQISGFQEDFSGFSFAKVLREELRQQFARLLVYCKRPSISRENLAFILSLLVFGKPSIAKEVRVLLAFAVSPALRCLPFPDSNTYNLSQGRAVNRDELSPILWQCERAFVPPPENGTDGQGSDDNPDNPQAQREEYERELSNQRQQYERELGEQRQQVFDAVDAAWPAGSVRLPAGQSLTHYNVANLTELLNGRLATWFKNYTFWCQLETIDKALTEFDRPWDGPKHFSSILKAAPQHETQSRQTHFSLMNAMHAVPDAGLVFDGMRPSALDGDLATSICTQERARPLEANELRHAWEELEEMCEELSKDRSSIAQNYGTSLNESIKCLKMKAAQGQAKLRLSSGSILGVKSEEVKDSIKLILDRSQQLLRPSVEWQQGLVSARIWPHVSPLALLQLLTALHRAQVPQGWLRVASLLAKEVTALQRVERMQKYLGIKDQFALQRELTNPAHAAWDPEQWPDWLLLEIQNNILIRPVQVRVAQELIRQENGLVLLGMGEGKTSVILPMVVTALATGSHLVRVAVLKPLANEMLRLLSLSLAGLVGRSVYHLPFSRQTRLTAETPNLLMGLFEECRKSGGVLLTLPEHLNSFRLIGGDKLVTDKTLSVDLIRVQKWLDEHSRDILDESDELLKPGYELVYTNGEANVLSGAPDRWIIALDILASVQRNARTLHADCPSGIELESRGPACFPHLRILNDEGARLLNHCLTQDIITRKIPSLPLGHCDPATLTALSSFLHELETDPADFDLVSRHFQGSAQLDLLYVARGLLSHQVLTHALRKRWLVNYGLDRTRCLAAVPYRAKSVPSPSAEFAQPETLILLTALSFYYTGIQIEDLRRCILILMKSPDPGDEYSRWVADTELPPEYRSANSLNLDDAYSIDKLYAHLQYNKAVIDFFLRQVVYPKEAKEFRHKLSSSAWDLCANDGGKVTSGFSGTCDSRIPLTCFQKDLEDLRHGTASALTTLLRVDNRKYVCAASVSGERMSTEELLQLIVDVTPEGPAVIIDVGAQFLEDNKEIASEWLRLRRDKKAAIYFSENDEKMVLNQDGSIEPFASSIFKDEIGGCLIYLDEFHTRGTDFQLPDDFKAAVLLGPGLLKDSLVQACMRMRKLAVSQSVIFFAPPEVDNSIRALLGVQTGDLDSSHVIRWCISQSCRALKSQQPLWTMKGLSHSRRRLASKRYVLEGGQIPNPEQYLDSIREIESRPVSEMYAVDKRDQKKHTFQPSPLEKKDDIMMQLLAEWDRTETNDLKDSGIAEEQEREILHEVEKVREVQRPAHATPAKPAASEVLINYIFKNEGVPKAEDFHWAFNILSQTRLAPQYRGAEWPTNVLVTQDYMRTIVPQAGSPQDDYLRPVQWIFVVDLVKQPIIISPHEAQVFLPGIRKHGRVTLILYQPRTSRNMMSFDGLNVYQVPERPSPTKISVEAISVLNLFAGQLYFTTFEDYKRLCSIIGLWDGERPLPLKRHVANDNFVSPACRQANGWTECKFSNSPVGMLKAFISMRRLGIEWGHTHMGRILSGRFLRRDEFEDEMGSAAEDKMEVDSTSESNTPGTGQSSATEENTAETGQSSTQTATTDDDTMDGLEWGSGQELPIEAADNGAN
ncbi:hypothetical protein HRR86_008095 [Exophiala dermatitidis]|nr:hypothetical protein HRR75_007156 [Exophiala dermatitidis]KAJ4541181.1 hypothetical protein HRR78_007527 [Exophiala dermatitidis]KAJ4615149.1 hypothetical protein HRR86_008095 [Exophiala dermatitidis]